MRNGEESNGRDGRSWSMVDGHVSCTSPDSKAAPRQGSLMQTTHKKVDRELFRVQDQEPSTYEIYNFNPTELDVSVSAQPAVKLIDPPVPQKHNQPKVSFPSPCRASRFKKNGKDNCTDNPALQQTK